MKTLNLIISIALVVALAGCGGEQPSGKKEGDAAPKSMIEEDKKPSKDIGVGPIEEINLPDTINQEMAEAGKAVFEAKCTACHKMGKRFVGPDLVGVVDRREPEWIMNMILDPELMVKENEAARELLMEYSAPMANQNITEEEARQLLEYFRTL